MHPDRRPALLGIEQKSGGQLRTNRFIRMQQREELRLVLEIGTRCISGE